MGFHAPDTPAINNAHLGAGMPPHHTRHEFALFLDGLSAYPTQGHFCCQVVARLQFGHAGGHFAILF